MGVITLLTTTFPPLITLPPIVVFANSTLDFNVQTGIIAGGFCGSIFLIVLFAAFVFNMCHCSVCGGGCFQQFELPDFRESCVGIFLTWLTYKYCACCCKDYRKKLAKQVEKLKQAHEMELQEEERLEKELLLFGQKEAK